MLSSTTIGSLKNCSRGELQHSKMVNSDGKSANVFYMGEDGQIYNWEWTAATSWTNSALGNGEPAGQGTGMAALWNPDGKTANVFYVADKGQPYNAPVDNWVLTDSSWTNGQL